ncbi:MAG: GAF domain-containing protein [Pseudomonadota bacterium]
MSIKEAGFSQRMLDILMSASRLDAVNRTAMMDSAPEKAFDELSGMAATLLQAPVAQVTFVGSDRQWFKSSLNFPAQEAPVATSFCAYTITTTDDVTVVLDAQKDPIFANNPFVANPPRVRFYTGCPIRVDGENVGTICVYDFEPRAQVSPGQIDTLLDLAERVARLVESKRTATSISGA